MEPLFIDLGFSQRFKNGEDICGDAFKYQKDHQDGRVVAVLSDGLGSGVKANILASMTATMALKFAAESEDNIVHSAEIMMSALPICQVRKISYATFTIVNASLNGSIRIIEMGNPKFQLFRDGALFKIPFETLESSKWNDRKMNVYNFTVQPGDRIVFFSDGISQAGMGSSAWPLGWREKGCAEFIQRSIAKHSDISSHELTEQILREARRKEPNLLNKDDMTCAALLFRPPRKMLLFTGPPYDRKRDLECAELVAHFQGEKVISGGTSAEIISRELHRDLKVDLSNIDSEMPPASKMEGIDLVTEGIFTLTKTAQYLDNYDGAKYENPAGMLAEMMLRNDVIDVLLGTRINEAHQDPNLPLDLELRRNIVKRIAQILEKNFLKKVNIRYV
ncbi:MAG: SpoIIE family protein phosphatase [Planctomycetia bacterium]|nr:SpoIIE family protein phosphatase [Planctomycetia bacterium]